ncbi:MAG: Peptidase M23 protein [Gammaproteobacteria bacterium]|nr:Peptidase M23 protein [Gammaproteobacteria bacterium]
MRTSKTEGFCRAFLIYLCCIVIAFAEEDNAQKAAELETLRTRIKDVESNIQAARSETDQIYKDLQDNEVAAAAVSQKLADIDKDINNSVQSLAELNVKQSAMQATLGEERKYLAQQIRAAYKMGKNDYLKLLLNQEDPARIGRMLAYYDYFNKARALRINQVQETLAGISLLERQIQTEKAALDQLRAEQLVKLEEYTSHRISRQGIIIRLENFIAEQDKQLHTLQLDEQELAELVSRLEQPESIVQTFEDIPPFNKLKGKLAWPVKGELKSRFGGLRKGGKLKWQGVSIAAASGNDVEAVSPGRVIFADWFRNMGLLLIIDHGGGYMSLYGHNERLLKKVGDWVGEREAIAKVGDTGGQQQPNLYFEIRHSGNPQDPGLWCKT